MRKVTKIFKTSLTLYANVRMLYQHFVEIIYVPTSYISVRCAKLASSVQPLFYHLLKLVGIVFVLENFKPL